MSLKNVKETSSMLHVEAWREAGVVAVYRDISDLLDNYEESPLAGSAADAAGARN